MNRYLLSIVSVGIAISSPFSAVGGTVSPAEAGNYQGQSVTVAGRVLYAFETDGGTTLSFDSNLKKGFSVRIPKADYAKFPSGVATLYSGKGVQVTGMVEAYQGRPRMLLHDPSQVRVISEAGLVSTAEIPTISAAEASQHTGQLVTVQGTVASARKGRTMCVLAFQKEKTPPFNAVIFASSLPKFPKSFEKAYQGKSVQITGVITLYKDAPQIVVTDPSQIEIR